MRSVLRVVSVAVAIGGLSAAPAAQAQILTIEDIEARAQRPRSELLEREAAIEKARAELTLIESKGGPTLGARVEGQVSPGGRLVEVSNGYLVSGSKPLGNSDAFLAVPRYGAMLSGKLTLLDFGRTKAGVRAAEAAIGAERASLLQAKLELVREARASYLDWVEAHQTWQLAERDLEVARARTVSVQALIAEGVRPATDATLSVYDEHMAQLVQHRAERATGMALGALGATVQSELPASSVPDLEVLEPKVAVASADPTSKPATNPTPPAEPDSPELAAQRALELKHRAALSAAEAAERATSPALDASAELGIQGQLDQVLPVYRAGISFSVPLWDGGQQAAQAAVHRAEARGIDARLSALKRNLDEQARAFQRRSHDADVGLELAQKLLDIAQSMLTEAEDHYRSGSDTLERVLGAQRSLVQARHEVLNAKLEAARARLELTAIKVQP